jgi:hypothetical protein
MFFNKIAQFNAPVSLIHKRSGRGRARAERFSEIKAPRLYLLIFTSCGGSGIRTHGRFTASGFQDQRIRPLCHTSERLLGLY